MLCRYQYRLGETLQLLSHQHCDLPLSPPKSTEQHPLTEANLRLLDPCAMPNYTPPTTPSKSQRTSTSTSSRPHRANEARRTLEHNYIFIDVGEDAKNPPAVPVLALATEIVSGQRRSTMKPLSLEKVALTRALESTSNESTFLFEFMKVLVKDSRISKSQDTPVEVWAERAWDKDHLKTNWNADFRSDSVPRRELDEANVSDQLGKQFHRVSTPRLDMIYGLKASAFTPEEQEINNLYSDCSILTPNLFHAFCILECKTSGSTEIAETQAAGGAAAVVNARRKFNAIAQDDPGQSLSRQANADGVADLNSISFSITLQPAMAQLFINWAEDLPTNGLVHYHMSFLKAYSLKQDKGLKDLRHDIDNVLDWGTLERKNEIKTQIAKIVSMSKS